MSVDTDLSEFFGKDVIQVVSDQERFRRRLKIGGDAFQYLKKAENVHTTASSLLGGAGAAGAVYAGWFASIGTLGQVGLAAGMVATPLGALAAAGAVGAGGMYLTQRLLKNARKGVVEEIPSFINTPIDVLGTTLIDILLPVLLKIADSDGEVLEEERGLIAKYLENEWGFDPHFIVGAIAAEMVQIDQWSFESIRKLINEVSKTGDLDVSEFKADLMAVARDVSHADGKLVSSEVTSLEALEVSLELRSSSVARRSFWEWLRSVFRLRDGV
jgi:tellurite resistance protein